MTKRSESKELYLAALRGDAKAQRACTEKGKQCGGRCIPKHWNCRIKGEGQTPPTRGNAVQLSAEQKEKIQKARSRRRTRRALTAIGGAAAVGAAVAGAATLGAKNPALALKLKRKSGAVSQGLGVASAFGGTTAAVAGAANMAVGGFDIGAGVGMAFARRKRDLGAFKRLTRQRFRLEKQIKPLESARNRAQSTLSKAQEKLSTEKTRLEAAKAAMQRKGTRRSGIPVGQKPGSFSQRRRGIPLGQNPQSIAQTDRARATNLKSAETAFRRANNAVNKAQAAFNTRESAYQSAFKQLNTTTSRASKLRSKLLKSQNPIKNAYNAGISSAQRSFRAGRRTVSSFIRSEGVRGPKPDPRSWQERFGMDEAEREDKKCGNSYIPDRYKCKKGAGDAKKRGLVSRISRKISGAEKREKFEREQRAREKKYGKHSPDANGGEAMSDKGPLAELLKKNGIDPTKIGGNSEWAINLGDKLEWEVKANGKETVRLKPGAKLEKLPAHYRLRKDSAITKREDKKCGNSGIPDNAKCTKKNTARTIAKAAAGAALVVGGAAALKNRRKIRSKFRKTGLTAYQKRELEKMRAKGTGKYGAQGKRSFSSEQKPFYSEADRIYPVKHKRLFRDSEAADAEGKKFSKTVTNPKTGRKRTVKYGAKGYSIAPGTNKGDRYCARSFGDMKSHNKNCAGKDRNTPLCLSRAKWKCSGKRSRRS